MDAAVLADSCRAKSEACHHSRNLRKKMDVGRRILRLSRRRGRMRRARTVGERRDRDVNGGAPGRAIGREAASNAR